MGDDRENIRRHDSTDLLISGADESPILQNDNNAAEPVVKWRVVDGLFPQLMIHRSCLEESVS